MSSLVILVRILVSTLLAGIVGIEREIHGCAAGLRTHILVSVGSTLFMLTSIEVALKYSGVGDVDASRIAAGVVTGIGFLGAGAIIRYGASIRGLTTAASIWAVAAIGLACGIGMYEAAGITTIVVMAVLILSRVEEKMELKNHGKKLRITLDLRESTDEKDIKNVIEAYGGRIKQAIPKKAEDGLTTEISFDLILARIYHKDIVSEISSMPGVDKAVWK
jgi:putative Mg2+ transporter-C (MgtC) family protein